MIIELFARNWMRSAARFASIAAVCLLLAGCSTGGVNLGGLFKDSKPQDQSKLDEPQSPLDKPQSPAKTSLKVALLLPLTAQGPTAAIGKSLKNAAELALLDSGSGGITLITKDTRASTTGAQTAANAALNEGADLILGPLLAQEVQAVAPVAQGRGVPVIAFSSASNVAGNGVYLMSFLPEEEVDNLVRYASSKGLRNLAALVPQSAYGSVAETALNQAAGRNGGSVVAIDRFPRTGPGVQSASQAMAGKILNRTNDIQALFIPEGGGLLSAAGNALVSGGVRPGTIQMLGTGLWDDAATARVPLAVGGWYAGVAPELVSRFDSRYQSTYGGRPQRIASLAYDAVSLAVIASKQARNGQSLSQVITNPEGYKGVNGLFRFRGNGRIQRGLAILEVTATGPRVVAPAPDRFSAGL